MFVLAGLISTILLLFWLTDPAFFRGRYKITTSIENVMGLNKGAPVQMRGVTVGKVHSLEMGREVENVVVTLEIEGQWLIPEGSIAQVVTLGLMDPKVVEVVRGPGPGTIGDGGSLPGSAVKGILDDTESLGEMGQAVLDRANRLLSDKNLDAISGSLEGLETLVAEFSDVADMVDSQRASLEELMQSLSSAADGIAEVTGPELRGNLTSTLAGADSLMGRLNATSENIEGVLASFETILTRIEDGQGTLGRLWASDTLYTNLTGAIESARLLLDDIRENPGRYINVSVF
jgi:phospholipid/cholesterol/gamma-HCH transport system substrate-binding protein